MASEDHPFSNHEHRGEVGRYALVALITIVILGLQITGGYRTGSIALFADSVHVALDGLSALLALYVVMAIRDPHAGHAFEARMTRISASLLLVGLALIVYHAVERLVSPIEIEGQTAFYVALAGGALNVVQIALLIGGKSRSIQKAQLLHALNDFGSSVAVCLGLWLTWQFGIYRADAIASLVAAALIAFHAVPMAFGKHHHHH